MDCVKINSHRNFNFKIYLFLLTVFCFFSIASPAIGIPITINVPGDQPTIQAGIDAAVDGDTVSVDDGIYIEQLVINGKYIILQGESRDGTIIRPELPPPPSQVSVIYIGNVTTTTVTNRLVLKDFTVEGGSFASIEFGRTGPADHVTLERLYIKDGFRGVEFHNVSAVTDVIIQFCEISDVLNQAIRMSTTAKVNGLVIESCDIHDNGTAGLYAASPSVTNIEVKNTVFTNCSQNSYSSADIVLTSFLGNVSFANVDVISSNSDSGFRITGKGGDKVSDEYTAFGPAGNISFSDVTITGTQGCISETCSNGKFPYAGAGIALGRYDDSSNISFSNVLIDSTALYGLHLGTMEGSEILDIAGVTFSGLFSQNIYLGSHGNRDGNHPDNGGLYRKSTVDVDATGAVFDNIACDGIEDDVESTVWHQADDPTLGLVTWECVPDCEPITGNEFIDEALCVVDGLYVDPDTGLATHGAYVKRVVLMANELFKNGDIDRSARKDIITRAAQSDVNKP